VRQGVRAAAVDPELAEISAALFALRSKRQKSYSASSCAELIRASTSLVWQMPEGVDSRDKPGQDDLAAG
jgi:hypothetical protein